METDDRKRSSSRERLIEKLRQENEELKRENLELRKFLIQATEELVAKK
jgi:hypothetical protein